MNKLDIHRIKEKVWRILNPDGHTFYLVEGENQAAVIDTGMTEGMRILPILRTLTEKTLVLILTHAHFDHFYHMDEFETVYMCHDELQMPNWFLCEMMCGKGLALEKTIHIDTDSIIDLGGRTLTVCKVPGHTPGSVVLFDNWDNLVFTGDAIGSGCGVWLQMPGSTSLAEYEQSLIYFLKWLMAGPSFMEFCGGHCLQRGMSAQVPGDNPLSVGLLADLIDLVHGLVNGTISGWQIDIPENFRAGKAACNAAFGRAEITYNPDYLM